MGTVLPPLGLVNDAGKFVPDKLGAEWTAQSKKPERASKLMLRRRCTRWHESRAKTKRELFERVDACGSSEGTKITLVCRSCKNATPIEVGCGSKWFCPTCRTQQVVKFRKDFNRKRLGLVTAATLAGYTRRNQKKSERWGERLATFTLPSRGSASERIEVLRKTWARFWRLLGDRLRGELGGLSSITFDDLAHNFPNGRPGSAPEFVPIADLLSYLLVFEWTPGKGDGLGHPHLHVWMFSRYIDNKEVLHPLWTRAYHEVARKMGLLGPDETVELLVPDVRKADHDVDRELIKYLTKDWEIQEGGAKRAAPEVFAEVYAQLDGKRLKQSSAGFAKWAVEKANVCPCCLYENQRGHWARVDIEHSLEESKVKEKLGIIVPNGFVLDDEGYYKRAPLTAAADYELRAQFDAKRDSEWSESLERRIVSAVIRKHLEGA